ncbi:hypothetical protein [Gilvimarinus agarilyticus]|uniref:hypothetical protein n=1 Tax=Gilvimarinus agarilyticus TaxID=679259 RepID=UPI00059F0CE3|nr:hypothetical protein [Gilvimarinus agarilyticus]
MNKHRGFGAVEYIIGLVFFSMALLTPLPGMEGDNVVDLLTDGIKSNHTSYIYAQSLSHMQIDETVITNANGDRNRSTNLSAYEEN